MNLLTFAEELSRELDRQLGVSFATEAVAANRKLLRGETTAADIRGAIRLTAELAGVPVPRVQRLPTPMPVAVALIDIARRAHRTHRQTTNRRFLAHVAHCRGCAQLLQNMHATLILQLAVRVGVRKGRIREEDAVGVLPPVQFIQQVERLLPLWGGIMLQSAYIGIVHAGLERLPEQERASALLEIVLIATSGTEPPDADTMRAIVAGVVDVLTEQPPN